MITSDYQLGSSTEKFRFHIYRPDSSVLFRNSILNKAFCRHVEHLKNIKNINNTNQVSNLSAIKSIKKIFFNYFVPNTFLTIRAPKRSFTIELSYVLLAKFYKAKITNY